MMKFSLPQAKRSLYRELILGLISLTFVAAVIVNCIGYTFLTGQEKAFYEKKSFEYSDYLHQALEWPIWNVDNELVTQIANAFAANAEVCLLIVRDESDREIYRRTKPYEQLITNKIAIEHNGEKIGSVELGLNLISYRQSSKQLLWSSISMMVLTIAILLVATRWMLKRLLKKPISALIRATSNVAEEKYQQNNLSVTYSEFIPILSSFRAMSETVAMREDSLRQINQQLAAEINERKQAEIALQEKTSELTRFFNVSLDLLCIADMEGRFLQLNPAWEQTLGFSIPELLQGRLFDFIHPDDLSSSQVAVNQVLARQEVCSFVNRYRCKEGNYRWMEWRGAAAGNLIYAAARDITERVQAEEKLISYKNHLEEQVQERTIELRLSRDAAEAANKAKSIFLANMSHELRTPLNAILGFSNIMCKDPTLTVSQHETLDIINRSGAHLLTLINDVLEMAKIEAGRAQLESKPFDLGGLVRDVIDMMQIRAREKNLQLLLDQSSSFPRYIKGDEAKIRQVLVNLIGNAIKFTCEGGVTVRLGTQTNHNPYLIIEVEDSGVGISLENQQRIFKPFFQVGERSSEHQGTGLGLTITQQFVQLMSGSINVTSMLDKGSLFRVKLPLVPASVSDIVPPDNLEHGDVMGLVAGQPQYRILIVEDQKENQLLLARLMETLGLPLKFAENGEQSVAIFQSWKPDLIWMDRQMPIMDGLEATRKIRQLPGGKEVKIVAVTASAFSEQRAEMLAAGMDDFVRKPYRSAEIYDCLSRQLNIKYLYADISVNIDETKSSLTAQMLEVLSSEIRNELHNAIESLDAEKIDAAIAKVALQDIGLSRLLVQLSQSYDYPAILNALEKL
jgi:PAS domain S-box-containing protein